VSFRDRIRKLFRPRTNSQLRPLALFAAERKGVEGYIEPQTATSPTTLLLVDRDGDHVRGPVREPRAAASFCEKLGIPVYDAAVIGYPKRMRDAEKNWTGPARESLDEQFADLERRFNEPGHDAPNN
jgi:hypothetical protein